MKSLAFVLLAWMGIAPFAWFYVDRYSTNQYVSEHYCAAFVDQAFKSSKYYNPDERHGDITVTQYGECRLSNETYHGIKAVCTLHGDKTYYDFVDVNRKGEFFVKDGDITRTCYDVPRGNALYIFFKIVLYAPTVLFFLIVIGLLPKKRSNSRAVKAAVGK